MVIKMSIKTLLKESLNKKNIKIDEDISGVGHTWSEFINEFDKRTEYHRSVEHKLYAFEVTGQDFVHYLRCIALNIFNKI